MKVAIKNPTSKFPFLKKMQFRKWFAKQHLGSHLSNLVCL
jgi:hypothetical protein